MALEALAMLVVVLGALAAGFGYIARRWSTAPPQAKKTDAATASRRSVPTATSRLDRQHPLSDALDALGVIKRLFLTYDPPLPRRDGIRCRSSSRREGVRRARNSSRSSRVSSPRVTFPMKGRM